MIQGLIIPIKGLRHVKKGDVLNGHLGYTCDVNGLWVRDSADWYKLVVDRKRQVKITMEGTEGLYMRLFLYQYDAYTKQDWTWGKNQVLVIEEELEPGIYYIEASENMYEGTYGSYTLTIE